MRVVVDALPARHGGGKAYVEQQLSALDGAASELRLHTFVSPWSGISAIPGVVTTVQVRSVPTRFAFEQWSLPRVAADVLYCALNFGPVRTRKPMVVAVHNAHFYGSGLEMSRTMGHRSVVRIKANHLAMRAADVVVAISNSLAAEIARTLPEVSSKLRVIHSGAPVWPSPAIPLPGGLEDYLLTVGSAARHKRTEDVVKAWAGARDKRQTSIRLVIVGNFSEADQRNHRKLAGKYATELVHTGQLTDRRNLRWLYENARAFVLATSLESFSFTPIEAGSLGCPAIITDLPVHREVAADNAEYFEVADVDRLQRILAYHMSAQRGRRTWDWPMTWDQNALELYSVFREVV